MNHVATSVHATKATLDDAVHRWMCSYPAQAASILIEHWDSVRDIALTDQELGYLTIYIESARPGASNHHLLFVTVRGCKIHHGNFMKRVFIPAVQRIGLEDLRPHDLRRTSATILAESGVPPTSTKNRMGHDSFSTTDKYYVVPTKASQQATAGIVSSVLKLDLTNRDELA